MSEISDVHALDQDGPCVPVGTGLCGSVLFLRGRGGPIVVVIDVVERGFFRMEIDRPLWLSFEPDAMNFFDPDTGKNMLI